MTGVNRRLVWAALLLFLSGCSFWIGLSVGTEERRVRTPAESKIVESVLALESQATEIDPHVVREAMDTEIVHLGDKVCVQLRPKLRTISMGQGTSYCFSATGQFLRRYAPQD